MTSNKTPDLQEQPQDQPQGQHREQESGGDPTSGPSSSLARSVDGARRMNSTAETIGLIAGVLGATALVFGFILYALDPGVLILASGNFLFGALGLLIYLVTHGRSVRRSLRGRSTPFVLLETLVVGGVVAGTFTANYFASLSTQEWDLTHDKLYTLHEQSAKVTEGLTHSITFLGFYKPTDNDRIVLQGVFDLYRSHTDRIHLEFISPDTAPAALIQKYKLTEEGPRIVIVNDDTKSWAKITIPTEEDVTNALIRVAERPPRKVYFVVGHDEPSIDDVASTDGFGNVATALRNDGYDLGTISFLEKENVPDHASAIVIAGAKSGFFKAEVDAIRSWLDRGGRALFLLEPGIDNGLEEIWRRHGIRVDDDLVVEANPTAVSKDLGPEAPIVQTFEDHAITRPLKNTAAIFLRTRSIEPRLGLANITTTTLVRTSPTSWGETKYREGGEQVRDDQDTPGPVPIAIAVTRKTVMNPNKRADEARLVVFGDFHFATNRFSVFKGDIDLFINSVNWLSGDEDRITIRPPRRSASRLPLSDFESYAITFFSVNLLPLLIMGVGLSVWAVQRRK